ncbi:MAG: helix-turn-helix transcriptional regulator [Ruminococcaceae bacterium]|nr:helix-turn-helix transcriptional regulator [Oscillospiraceae bacterium]
MNNGTDTKQSILDAARKEFLQCGYHKASLREICRRAGTTTGALYFFFKNKVDLFESVVSEKAERLMYLIRRQSTVELCDSGEKEVCQSELNKFLCDNKDEILILLNRSEGTPYEGFRDEFGRELARGFFAFYDNSGGTEEYRDIMKFIIRMRVQGYIEMLNGDYDMDRMMKFSALMEAYGDSGFAGMMDAFDSITKGSVG